MFYSSLLRRRKFRYLGAFYLHSIVRYFAVSLFQLFNGIYILQLARNSGFGFNQSLSIVAFTLCIMYIFDALSVAPSVWIMANKGLKFAVLWGNLSLVAFYIILSLAKYDLIFLAIAAVFGGVATGLYWSAYHTYFVHLSDDKKQGEEISIGTILSAIASIGGPAFGALIISFWGFGALFIFLSILVVLAIIPLRFLPKQQDKIEINLLPIIMTLSPRKEWRSFAALAGDTVGDLVVTIFLPIFILPILSGIIGVGFVGSMVAFFALLVTFLIGWLIDKFGPKRVINVFAPVEAIAWAATTLISLPIHAYIMSFVYAFTRTGQSMSMDTTVYQRARHEDLIAFIFQRELGMSVARFVFLFVMAVLFWFNLPLVVIFVITGLLALMTRLYPYQTEVDKEKIENPLVLTSPEINQTK